MSSPARDPRRLLAAAIGFSLLAACSAGDAGGQRQLTIFAASSLTEAFTTLEDAYEQEHEGVDVVISFGSSTTLAEQIVQGAPADLVATADDTSMRLVVDAELNDGEPIPVASNTMALVTPAGNPAGIRSPADLRGADFVVCDPVVPCGAAAERVLAAAGVDTRPRSFEADVKAVLAKVRLGEVDAGLVYATDAAAADELVTVEVPDRLNTVNAYYIAVVRGTELPALAEDWVALVSSQAGQRVLADAGFGPP